MSDHIKQMLGDSDFGHRVNGDAYVFWNSSDLLAEICGDTPSGELRQIATGSVVYDDWDEAWRDFKTLLRLGLSAQLTTKRNDAIGLVKLEVIYE